MTKEKLNLAAWIAIINAVITIPIIGLSIFFNAQSGAGAKVAQAILLIGSLWLFIYIFGSLKELLNTGFGFYDTDIFIKLLIWINVGSTAVSIFPLLIPRTGTVIGMLNVLLLIPMGVIFIIFSIKLLKLTDSLYGMLKPFVYMSIVTGFCFATIFLIPFALITSAASDIILGIIFFRASENITSPTGEAIQ